MDQLIHTIVGLWQQVRPIIIRAIPTFVLVWLLYFFLKKVLFQPLERTLEERRKRTLGAVADAEAKLAEVEKKQAGYEQSLMDARSAIYQEQEAHRKRLAEDQRAAVEGARGRMAAQVTEAKTLIGAEAASAKDSLGAEAERLAEEIASALLVGRRG